MRRTDWFALIALSVVAGCSSPSKDDKSYAPAKRAVAKPALDEVKSPRAGWMDLPTDSIQLLADQALSCGGDVHRVTGCPPVVRRSDAWVDWNRNDRRVFDSINLSFEVPPKDLALEPLAKIPPAPLRLIHFFFPNWRGGSAWLRYAVKLPNGECGVQTSTRDAIISVRSEYRYDRNKREEGFISELRIYPPPADYDRLRAECVREEVTDDSEVRSQALSAGVPVDEAMKLKRDSPAS